MFLAADNDLGDITENTGILIGLLYQSILQYRAFLQSNELLQGAEIILEREKGMLLRGTCKKRLFKVCLRKFDITLRVREQKPELHAHP